MRATKRMVRSRARKVSLERFSFEFASAGESKINGWQEAYSLDLRERVLGAWQREGSQATVAKRFGVSERFSVEGWCAASGRRQRGG